MRCSPLMMEILCFARYAGKICFYQARVPPQAISIGNLVRYGLLTCESMKDEGGHPEKAFGNQTGNHTILLTPKGNAWLDKALSTPLPVQKTVWVFEEGV